ncbi:hypothetical protein [Marinagarivorans cellulosilyticus]|uniref:Uncharacterized protein n=1 Tax=Marinagarivorans cellulosilyticus TaxID=2721545 RepID=A0AAN2BK62_9GAMM|nr:hypothetical protein [Marinagarivorans cellulosilyticus]BCD97743.1 hypothetical protein MARGE09_P1944 [Marinagarivorans cellulosilyticus]
MNKERKIENLNYAAYHIYEAFVSKGYAEAYLDEKLDTLLDCDKFQAILFLHNCDADIQRKVADVVGVDVLDLKKAIEVMGHF